MFQVVSSETDLSILFAKSNTSIKYKHILSNISTEFHLIVPVSLPPISLADEA